MKNKRGYLAAILLVTPLISQMAWADPQDRGRDQRSDREGAREQRREHEGARQQRRDYEGYRQQHPARDRDLFRSPDYRWRGDIHRFDRDDAAHWRSGRWHHGHHDGRLGWWWIVGGVWYLYNAPVYPYPDPYLPPQVVLPPAPPASQFWYYCPNPPGYYPYVPECRYPWERVPARPY